MNVNNDYVSSSSSSSPILIRVSDFCYNNNDNYYQTNHNNNNHHSLLINNSKEQQQQHHHQSNSGFVAATTTSSTRISSSNDDNNKRIVPLLLTCPVRILHPSILNDMSTSNSCSSNCSSSNSNNTISTTTFKLYIPILQPVPSTTTTTTTSKFAQPSTNTERLSASSTTISNTKSNDVDDNNELIHVLYKYAQLRIYDYVRIKLLLQRSSNNNNNNNDTIASTDSGHNNNNNSNNPSIIVQLHTIDLHHVLKYDNNNNDNNNNYNNIHHLLHDSNTMITNQCYVYIDPILAMNLGYTNYNYTNHSQNVVPLIQFETKIIHHNFPNLDSNNTTHHKTTTNSIDQDQDHYHHSMIGMANQITLYYIDQRQIKDNSYHDDNHDTDWCNHNNHSSSTALLPLPTIGSILQSNTIIRLVKQQQQQQQKDDRHHHDDEHQQQLYHEYFYEVGDIIMSSHPSSSTTRNDTNNTIGNTNHNKQQLAYQTTSETQYHIIARPKSFLIPLLPPIISLNCPNSCNNSIIPSHPITKQIIQQWKFLHPIYTKHANTTNSSCRRTRIIPEQCIYHMIGTCYEHDTKHILQMIGHEYFGRQCIYISGLAATAHLYRNYNEQNNTSTIDNEYTVTTGGWIDKLQGLYSALQVAISKSPSILIISDLDHEFTSLSHDPSIRQLEESRVWTMIIDTLSSLQQNDQQYTSNHISTSSSSSSSSILYTPAVIVVLVTTTTLPNGPLLQNLIYDSITFTLPDNTYIDYLWTKRSIRSLSSIPYLKTTSNDNKCDATSKSLDHNHCSETAIAHLNAIPISTLQQLMKGRTVQEILDLRQEFIIAAMKDKTINYIDTTPSDETNVQSVLVEMLKSLCEQKDILRRRKSGIGRISAVHWSDVGGLDHVRNDIRNTIELPLQYSHLFGSSSQVSRSPSGILLYGPPGTGKTFVAKAIATEYNLPFLSVKGPELLGSYVGESEAQVRSIFTQARTLAKQNQPKACILFFDELDSLAPRRGDHSASGGNVMDRVVASLFIELDNDPIDNELVFCVGATNRPDMLDPALLRPGRFDRLVYLGVTPNDQVRILTTHLRKLRLDGEAEEMAEQLVQHLPANLTAADLSTIGSGALMRATERLCDEADRQLMIRQQEQSTNVIVGSSANEITIDDILESWNDEKLQPIVTIEDLIEVALNVVPSVNAFELEKYEQLNLKYRNDDE